jgi:hypothetical protein
MLTNEDLQKEIKNLKTEIKDLKDFVKVLYSMIMDDDEEYVGSDSGGIEVGRFNNT